MRKSILLAFTVLTFWATPGMSQNRYASHSVMASGHWAKIRIPETGVYTLTDDLLRRAGFSDPSVVKVYGYGGMLQPEKITPDYITRTDDLKEVPTCIAGNQRLFYGVGPVTWNTPTDTLRTRNSYSNYGYYFLTDVGGSPQVLDSAAFTAMNYPSFNDYHALYEVEDFCWYHGGRNIFDKTLLSSAEELTYTLPAYSQAGKITVSMTYEGYCNADVYVNGVLVGQVLVSATTASKTNKKLKSLPDDYSDATVDQWIFNIKGGLKEKNTVTIRQTRGGKMRLDYLLLTSTQPKPLAALSTAKLPVPELVGKVENQDLHAHPQADMVIIIPANRNFAGQAERLKKIHEAYDGLRVNIVAADQLFNEFSSGTPDATAYRRYMKMLYDRAKEVESEKPRFLLLFGDGAWDNRMCSEKWRNTNPDDFLLCYESDNSFSETKCYVSDDYYCLLDDNEGTDMLTDKIDAAVGRFPARTEEEAAILVDKVDSYLANLDAGPWQNTLCLMGDDGDKNRHMNDAELVAEMIKDNFPNFNVKKILWDAYTMRQTASGDRYPEVTTLIKEQMQIGALVMNYSGHGNSKGLSHENVISIDDFNTPTSLRLPLWLTASCDIMPFDEQDTNLGDAAMFNPNGGAIAFFGTTRTVYAAWNRPLNLSFMRHVMGSTNGKRNTIGQAAMMAKNEFSVGSSRDMIVNKQQFTLLGDPAIRLAAPTLNAVVDKINGQNVGDGKNITMKVGQKVTVTGHIEGQDDFNGGINYVVRDIETTIKCRLNNSANADTAMVYKDRPNTVYAGSSAVKNGQFELCFTVPKDISYIEAPGQIQLLAYNDDRSLLAHGECEDFVMAGEAYIPTDGVGPRVYCYLENETFTNGAVVGSTPLLYAMIADNEGINTSDVGIGHNIELCIDGKTALTYNMNPYFKYSFGDYTTGELNYTLPVLTAGNHWLTLRAWDVMNNSATYQCNFVVADRGIAAIDDAEAVAHDNGTGTVYDLQGRLVSSTGESRGKAIYLKRDSKGKVRKLLK